MPHLGAPNWRRKKRRKKRSVFVVARPLKVAGPLSFASEGKFPLCHWGLLISEADPTNITSRWETYCKTKDLSSRPPRGTLFELVRLGQRNTHNKREDFGLEVWDAEWGNISIQHVGKTALTDRELAEQGGPHLVTHAYYMVASIITQRYPDYHAYTNNCQNFVLYLLQFACEEFMAPKSISEVTIIDFTSIVQNAGNNSLFISVSVVLFD